MSTPPIIQRFREKFGDFFKTADRVIQAKGHYEKEYLHRVPTHMNLSDGSIIPEHFIGNAVEDGSVDKRDVYVTERRWKASELMEDFLLTELQREKEEVMKVIRKEKETWAEQSIGWKAVESVENAFKEREAI